MRASRGGGTGITWGTFVATIHLNTTFSAGAIPFYLLPTLGGSDIEGNPVLWTYKDYRFRGQHRALARLSWDSKLFIDPLGILVFAEVGKVGMRLRDVFDPGGYKQSMGGGLALRVGGAAVVQAVGGWGAEGWNHNEGGNSNLAVHGNAASAQLNLQGPF